MMLNFLTLIYAVIFRDKVLGCKQGTLKRVNKNKLEIFRVIFILGARRQKKLGLSSVLQWISASASWLEAEKIDGEKLRRSLSWQLAEKNKKMTWKGTQDWNITLGIYTAGSPHLLTQYHCRPYQLLFWSPSLRLQDPLLATYRLDMNFFTEYCFVWWLVSIVP